MEEKNDNQNLYTIGNLAKILGVPVSTLRYYERMELLVPEIRGENNQYRYYTETQVLDAINIICLKRMGINLQDIKLVLKHKRLSVLKANMQKKMQECRSQINALEKQYQTIINSYQQVSDSIDKIAELYVEHQNKTIEDTLDGKGTSDYPCQIAYMEKTMAAVWRFTNSFGISQADMQACLALNAYIEQNGLQISGPLSMVFYDEENVRFNGGSYEVELLYPIEKTTLTGEHIGSFGGFWYCGTLHMGDYAALPQVFSRVRQAIEEKGYRIAGHPYEQYLVDFLYLNNMDYFLTQVAYPVEIIGK
ncbi:MAG: MerR family transcriptional regulator [Bacillota bacterium]|nr:MerR family transcriptional regulator [Bacillota bacterium]